MHHIGLHDIQIPTVFAGLAPDGGLYIPEHIPELLFNWKTAWSTHSFIDLSVEILSLYTSPKEIFICNL